MKRTEKVLWIIFLIGVIFKFTHIPFHALIIVVTLLLLSFFYFYFGFALFNNIPAKSIFKKESYKGITVLRLIGSIVSGFSVSIICIGLLYKIQHWQMAMTYLMVGFVSCTIILIIAFIKNVNSKDSYYPGIIKSILPVIITTGILTLITTFV